MGKGRFNIKNAVREWNSLAKKGHRVLDKEAFAEECRKAYAETGYREIEMSWTQASDGVTHLIPF